MLNRLRSAALGLLAAMAGAMSQTESTSAYPERPHLDDGYVVAAVITDPDLAEISGLAVSRLHADVLWTHNDSGFPAQIHAMGSNGQLLATVQLRGADSVDYEDIAAFELDGVPYLMVGDIGDNGGVRRELQLYVFREPELIADGEAELAWMLRFRWPDGPRDSEALAVDPIRGEVLLASKKRVPAELFRLPLRAAADQVLVAEPVGLLTHIAQPTPDDLVKNPVYGRYRAQITGLDLSADGSRLAVLNYLQAYVYQRNAAESWQQALARQPLELRFPWLAQAEAIAFDPDGRGLWIGTERLPAPLLRVSLPEPATP